MIDARERIHYYRGLGLETEQGFDQPGTEYEPHRHEKTILYTIHGSLLLRREGLEMLTLYPGSEEVIEGGQLHSAKVGETGWKYIAAWDAQEATEYEH